MAGILYYNSHLTTICLLYTVKIAEAVFPYVFKMAFPASLLMCLKKIHLTLVTIGGGEAKMESSHTFLCFVLPFPQLHGEKGQRSIRLPYLVSLWHFVQELWSIVAQSPHGHRVPIVTRGGMYFSFNRPLGRLSQNFSLCGCPSVLLPLWRCPSHPIFLKEWATNQMVNDRPGAARAALQTPG